MRWPPAPELSKAIKSAPALPPKFINGDGWFGPPGGGGGRGM